MNKITEDTKIKDYLSQPEVYGHRPEFESINPDYTFAGFYKDLKSNFNSICKKLNAKDDDILRQLLSKIHHVSCSKFRWPEYRFEESLPMRLWYPEDFLKKILTYLTEEKSYFIYAHDTHRWISSDGWYELEYNLQDDNGTDVYLTTYSSHEQDFEDDWSSEDGHHVTPGDLYMNDWKDDPLWIMSNLAGNDKVRSDIRPDFLDEMTRRLKKRFPDSY